LPTLLAGTFFDLADSGIRISRWSGNTAVFTGSGYVDSASALDAEIAFAVL
jgi:hypothetical protein